MAIAVTIRSAAGDTSNTTAYATGSFTPTANALIIACFAAGRGSNINPDIPAITNSGTSLTWTQIADLTFLNSGVARGRITMFAARAPASPVAMVITATYAGANTGVAHSVFEVTGSDVGNVGVASCIVQAVNSTAGATGTTCAITLAAAGNSNNRAFLFVTHTAAETYTVDTAGNWAQINTATHASPAQQSSAQWNGTAFDTSVTTSWTTSTNFGGIAFEIKAATPAIIVADKGTHTLSGKDVIFAIKLPVDKGTLTLSGQAVGLRRSLKLVADKGAFVQTGKDATLTYTPVSGGGAVTVVTRGSGVNNTFHVNSPITLTGIVTIPDTTGISLVGVALGSPGLAGVVTAVTLGGVSVTQLVQRDSNDQDSGGVWLGYVLNSALGTGSKDLVATWSPGYTDSLIAGVVCLNGQHPSTPLGTPVSNVGTNSTPTVAVTDSATGDKVIDISCIGSVDLTSNQTAEWHIAANSGTAAGNAEMSSAAGASGTVTMSSEAGGANADWWAIAAVTVKAAPGGAAAYTLTAAKGAYTHSGQTVNLTRQLKPTADKGTYAITGVAAGLTRQLKLVADKGAYAQTGQSVAFIRQLRLTADKGTYAQTGIAVNFDVKLPADRGTYTVSGQAVNFLVKVPVDKGAYTVAGQAVLFRRTYFLTADKGSYTQAGQAVNFAIKLPADKGTYTQAGQSVNLTRQLKLTADKGAFTQSGKDVAFRLTRILTADKGTYTQTGRDAILTKVQVRTLAADKGVYTQSGQAIQLLRTLILRASVGSYLQNGQPVTLAVSLPVSQGTYTVAGQPANLLRNLKLSASQGTFLQTGQTIVLSKGRLITASTTTFTLNGQVVQFRYSRAMPLGPGSYALAGQGVAFSVTAPGHLNIIASGGSYALVGKAANLLRNRIIAIPQGTYNVTGQTLVVRRGWVLQSFGGLFVITWPETNLTTTAEARLIPNTGFYVLSGKNINLRRVRPPQPDIIVGSSGKTIVIPLGDVIETDLVNVDGGDIMLETAGTETVLVTITR